MTNRTKIVFVGATSMSFGLSMLRDIFSTDELRGSTLTLVGRNTQTLAKMTELAKQNNVYTRKEIPKKEAVQYFSDKFPFLLRNGVDLLSDRGVGV